MTATFPSAAGGPERTMVWVRLNICRLFRRGGRKAGLPHPASCGPQREIADAHEVVRGDGEGEDPVYPREAAVPGLPDHSDRLQPSEDLLDSLPLSLADVVALMTSGATVDRATADLPSHVGCRVTFPQRIDKGPHVVALVAADRDVPPTRHVLEKVERRLPLCGSCGPGQPITHSQTVAVLHHHMTHEVQLRFLPARLGVEPRVRVLRGLVGVVAPLLSL